MVGSAETGADPAGGGSTSGPAPVVLWIGGGCTLKAAPSCPRAAAHAHHIPIRTALVTVFAFMRPSPTGKSLARASRPERSPSRTAASDAQSSIASANGCDELD